MPNRWLVLFLLTVSYASCAAAQQPRKSQSSPTPRTIILPARTIAGEATTLAVLDSEGRLLPNITVEFSGGRKVITDSTGRALFHAPNEAGRLIATIARQGISASTNVLAADDSGSHAGVQVSSYPHVVAVRDRFTVEGWGFAGAADSNHVYLADRPCLILASSPIALVVLPGPNLPLGNIKFHVTVAGIEAGQFAISAVQLEFSGPEESANAGASGKLILRARGTTEPLIVEVRNGSPKVIQLLKGNVQRVKTSGGNPNIAPVDARFLAGGDYSISARLISADACCSKTGTTPVPR